MRKRKKIGLENAFSIGLIDRVHFSRAIAFHFRAIASSIGGDRVDRRLSGLYPTGYT
ncbi:hypothetical protein H6F67_16175 [Microcoleus sp. FACHB-1515]|uniref:hypothetical protein n=1 Tax=Cyanophyceae TaxID=3028117 RepID=UPI001688198D|nr:hypothetical protein [Microcoleus sp. FACHB-1515]MBD2091384.1 hypothetical protein [Microcoleus sp. FACHB-1515]